MLQYLTQHTDRFSITEQCQMVIEGGCSWIQLSPIDITDIQIRQLSEELIPLCKETSTILMIENNPELAKELGIHGVHITLDSGLNPIQIREDFGPEAIIGVELASVATLTGLQNADIDYVSLPEGFTLDEASSFINEASELGNKLPIVCRGNFDIEKAINLIELGANGICTGKYIIQANDPVAYTAEFISKLTSLK